VSDSSPGWLVVGSSFPTRPWSGFGGAACSKAIGGVKERRKGEVVGPGGRVAGGKRRMEMRVMRVGWLGLGLGLVGIVGVAWAQNVPVLTGSTLTEVAVELPAASPVSALVCMTWQADATVPPTDLYYCARMEPGEVRMVPVWTFWRTNLRAYAINEVGMSHSLAWGE